MAWFGRWVFIDFLVFRFMNFFEIILAVVIILLLHEFAHFAVAKWLRKKTKLKLFPKWWMVFGIEVHSNIDKKEDILIAIAPYLLFVMLIFISYLLPTNFIIKFVRTLLTIHIIVEVAMFRFKRTDFNRIFSHLFRKR